MDLSAMQPGPSAAEVGIFTTFLPANAGSASAQPGLFGRLLEDALGLAAPADPAVEASGESAATVDMNGAVDGNAESVGNAAAPLPGQAKAGGRKKPDAKIADAGNARPIALYALTMAPVPIGPLQKLDPPATAPVSSSQAAQSQQVSGAQILAAPGSGVQPADRAQSGASIALEKIATVGFQVPTNAEGPLAKAGQEGQSVALPEQGPPTGQPAPKVAEPPRKKDGPNLEAGVGEGFFSRKPQSEVESSSPAAQLPVPKTSQHVQPNEWQEAGVNVPDDDALTNTTRATTNTIPSQKNSSAPAATQIDPVQAVLVAAATANLFTSAIANLVSNAQQDPSSIISSATPVAASTPVGSDTPESQTIAVALPQPPGQLQMQPQLPPRPQAQSQPQAQPQEPQTPPEGLRHQPAEKAITTFDQITQDTINLKQ